MDILTITVLGSGLGIVVLIAILVVFVRRNTAGETSQIPYKW